MQVREILYPIGPSIAYVPLTRGLHALIDRDTAPSLNGRSWHAFPNGDGAYYAKSSTRIKQRCVGYSMHRQLLLCRPGEIADHKNGNTLDNRMANLRIATKEQNAWNSTARKGRTLPKCVYVQRGRYRARIEFRGRRINLGLFADVESASRAVNATLSELQGEFWRGI